MKSKILALAVVASMLLLSIGCTTYPPLINSIDIGQVDYSQPMKRSQDCSIFVLGFLGPFGQTSIMDAIRKANIRKVTAAEYSYDWYVVFTRSCVDIWGQ